MEQALLEVSGRIKKTKNKEVCVHEYLQKTAWKFHTERKKKIIPEYLTVSYCAEGFKISSSFYVCVCGITGYHRGSVSSKLIA